MHITTRALVALSAAGSIAAAKPYAGHNHRHVHDKRVPVPDGVQTVTVPGPTVLAFLFEGNLISEADVCEGLADGEMAWAPGSNDTLDCSALSSSSSATPTQPAATTSANSGNELLEQTPSASPPASTPSSSASGSSSGDSSISSNSGVDLDFPDGQLDCSTFPSEYGAIDISWMGLHGWSGIQYVQDNGQYVTNIVTATAGHSCQLPSDIYVPSGSYPVCSYACPPGFQKSQWPELQGPASSGTSVGGLLCGPDNKLHLTNPGLSSKLCIPGTGKTQVENDSGADVAICRTDYPGTEDETVPLDVPNGATLPLTCPDASTYYHHLGMATSAEYYINMKGVPVDQACTWSTDGSYEGNWAPNVLGVGTDASGNTWLSIQSTIQNNPSSYKNLDFTVELQGDFGGDNACFYVNKNGNGYYCSVGTPSNYDPSNCVSYDPSSHPVPGCTVQLMSGTATYALSP